MDSLNLDFTGKTVLVVGGSGGIGNAAAQAFRARGADVYVWGTRPSAADYEGNPDSDMTGLHYTQVDVTDYAVLEAQEVPFDKLDVLILSQGMVRYKRQEYQAEVFSQVVDLNLTSVMACVTKFQPMLIESKGSITIVASVAAYLSLRGTPAYAASKAGAVSLVRSLAQGFAAEGVRVNGLAPGYVPTRMTTTITDDEERAEATKGTVPMGRFGTVEEMAGVALFLASPLAGYVTGHTVVADGGLTL